MNGDIIGNGFSGFTLDQAEDLLEMRGRDLFGVFAYLDLWDDVAVAVLDSSQLVNPAENRGAF